MTIAFWRGTSGRPSGIAVEPVRLITIADKWFAQSRHSAVSCDLDPRILSCILNASVRVFKVFIFIDSRIRCMCSRRWSTPPEHSSSNVMSDCRWSSLNTNHHTWTTFGHKCVIFPVINHIKGGSDLVSHSRPQLLVRGLSHSSSFKIGCLNNVEFSSVYMCASSMMILAQCAAHTRVDSAGWSSTLAQSVSPGSLTVLNSRCVAAVLVDVSVKGSITTSMIWCVVVRTMISSFPDVDSHSFSCLTVTRKTSCTELFVRCPSFAHCVGRWIFMQMLAVCMCSTWLFNHTNNIIKLLNVCKPPTTRRARLSRCPVKHDQVM